MNSLYYGGFAKPGQEARYNATVVDLISILAARVHASLKSSKPPFWLYLCVLPRNPWDIRKIQNRGQSGPEDRKALPAPDAHGTIFKLLFKHKLSHWLAKPAFWGTVLNDSHTASF